MDFFDLAKLMFRWWFIAVPALLLTIAGATILSARAQPEFTARGSMILVGPTGEQASEDSTTDFQVINPLLSQNGALPTTAYVTALSMNSPEVAALLSQEGLSTSYDVAAETRLPIILLETRASSRAVATDSALRLVQLIDQDLDFRQDAAVVPDQERVTVDVISIAIVGGADYGGRTRLRFAIAGFGLVSTVGLIFLLEGISRQRRREGDDGDPSSETEATPDPAADESSEESDPQDERASSADRVSKIANQDERSSRPAAHTSRS